MGARTISLVYGGERVPFLFANVVHLLHILSLEVTQPKTLEEASLVHLIHTLKRVLQRRVLHIRRMNIKHVNVTTEHLLAVLRVFNHVLFSRVASNESSLCLRIDGEVLAHVGFAEQLLALAIEGGGVHIGATAIFEDGEEFGELVGGGEGAVWVDAGRAEDCWEAGHCW